MKILLLASLLAAPFALLSCSTGQVNGNPAWGEAVERSDGERGHVPGVNHPNLDPNREVYRHRNVDNRPGAYRYY